MTDEPLSLASHWYAAAVVLLTEHRTCATCHAHFTAPNHELMVRLESVCPAGRRSLLRVRHLVAQTIDTTDLPSETREHFSTVERCSNCWHDAQPEGQYALFPKRKIVHTSWQAILAQMRQRNADEETNSARSAKSVPPSKIGAILANL